MRVFLTVGQVLERLPVSRATFFRTVKADPRFPAPHRIGRRTFYLAEEIDEYLTATRSEKGSPVAKAAVKHARHAIRQGRSPSRNFAKILASKGLLAGTKF